MVMHTLPAADQSTPEASGMVDAPTSRTTSRELRYWGLAPEPQTLRRTFCPLWLTLQKRQSNLHVAQANATNHKCLETKTTLWYMHASRMTPRNMARLHAHSKPEDGKSDALAPTSGTETGYYPEAMDRTSMMHTRM